MSLDELVGHLRKKMTKEEIEDTLKQLIDRRWILSTEKDGAESYELAHKLLVEPVIEYFRKEFADAELANLILDHRVLEKEVQHRWQLLTLKEYRLITKIKRDGNIRWNPSRHEKKELYRKSKRRARAYLALRISLFVGLCAVFYSLIPDNPEVRLREQLKSALEAHWAHRAELSPKTLARAIAALGDWHSASSNQTDNYLDKIPSVVVQDQVRNDLARLAGEAGKTNKDSAKWAQTFAKDIHDPVTRALAFTHLMKKDVWTDVDAASESFEAVRNMSGGAQEAKAEQVMPKQIRFLCMIRNIASRHVHARTSEDKEKLERLKQEMKKELRTKLSQLQSVIDREV